MSEQYFRGSCMGVKLSRRGRDEHVMITTLIEDDGIWHEKSNFSSYWLDEMIEKLIAAKAYLEDEAEPEPSGYGYKFKEDL